jgi:hypothetical protein
MKKAKIDIHLTPGPRVGDYESCYQRVVIQGDPETLAKMFAALLTCEPRMMLLIRDALVLKDRIVDMHRTSEQ